MIGAPRTHHNDNDPRRANGGRCSQSLFVDIVVEMDHGGFAAGMYDDAPLFPTRMFAEAVAARLRPP